MLNKLKSRKLIFFVITFLLVVANYVFLLGLPAQALLYLVLLTASYILGQGYVDGKQQPVRELPVTDITNALSDIVTSQLAKTIEGQTLPLDEIGILFKDILSTELSKVNTFTIAPSVPTITPANTPEVPITAG